MAMTLWVGHFEFDHYTKTAHPLCAVGWGGLPILHLTAEALIVGGYQRDEQTRIWSVAIHH